MSEIIPLKVGGSLLSTDSSALNFDYLFELRENLDRIASKHDLRFTINIGGGKLARSYMQAAKENGAVVENVHRVGVVTSNANVQLAHSVWGPTAYPKAIFYHDYDELIAGKTDIEWGEYRFLFLGASEPGYTNDWNATLTAIRFGAKVVYNLKNVDGVYTADPNSDKTAKKLDKIDWKEYIDVIGNPQELKAGGNFPVDIKAAKKCMEEGLQFRIIHGKDFESLEKAILGQKFVGTTIY